MAVKTKGQSSEIMLDSDQVQRLLEKCILVTMYLSPLMQLSPKMYLTMPSLEEFQLKY